MAIINPAGPRPIPVVPRVAIAKGGGPVGEEGDVDRTPGPALRRTALATALSMNDDLAGLVSSMRRARTREDGSDPVGSHAWLDHVLDEQGPQKLADLRGQLQQQDAPTVATLRGLIQQLFPEPSDALAIVRFLLADDELEQLHEQLAQLHAMLCDGEGARSARAGLNAALKARVRAAQLRGTPQQLRRSYQDFLVARDPIEAYELWIELYGFERRAAVLDFIEQALAADMYALDPSCTRLEFGQLLQSVRKLTTLRSADHLLQQYCWQPELMERMQLDRRQLLSALLYMVRSGGGLEALLGSVLATSRHVMSETENVGFAQSVRRFLKALPHALWGDVGLQVQALDEVDAVLDRALANERLRVGGMYQVNV